MPHSDRRFEGEIAQWIRARFDPAATAVLDVGAGSGRFAKMLPEFPFHDAIEVWGPTIEKYGLRDCYSFVFHEEALEFARSDGLDFAHDLILLGDVLEHWTPAQATEFLGIMGADASVLVQVPFLYPQDAHDGNPHEEHKQSDLTHALFMERYPGFQCVVRDEKIGVYAKLAPRHESAQRAAPQEEAQRTRETAPAAESGRVVLTREWGAQFSLAIATPIYGGTVCTDYLISVWRTRNVLAQLGIKLDLLMTESSVLENSRNALVARFMAGTYTHLLFIDSDQGWEAEHVLRLLVMERDLVGVAARKKTMNAVEWAVDLDRETYMERGAMRVNAIGTGFLLMSRAMIEKMIASYPHLKIRSADDAMEQDDPAFPFLYSLFQNTNTDGFCRSEDLSFCDRWRSIGGEVWCDPESDLIHVGRHQFRGALASAIRSIEPMEEQAPGGEGEAG